MTFNKILDTELDYMSFNMDKNIMIEFTDGPLLYLFEIA